MPARVTASDARLFTARFSVVTVLLSLLIITSAARGEVAVSSPLGGYCRVGRYAAEEVSTDGPAEIRGAGVLPVRIDGAATRAVVPLLVLETPGDTVTVGDRSLPLALRVLGDNERLVGVIGDGAAAFGRSLFAGKSVVAVPLDPTNPLPGHAGAWESLDAIVCDGALPESVSPDHIGALLGAGVTFAVRSGDDQPSYGWPWQRQPGGWWLLRHEVAGPTSSLSDAAYAPVQGWEPGVPARSRAVIVGFGALFVIAATGTALLRGRRARFGALAGASLATCLAVAGWAHRQVPVTDGHGTILASSGDLQQVDQWTYQLAARPGLAMAAWLPREVARPVLASPAQAAQDQLVLRCAADGTPRDFEAMLPAGRPLAYVARRVRLAREPAEPRAVAARSSPLRSLARDAYEPGGYRVTGGWPPQGENLWGGVVVEKASPPSPPSR